MTKNNADLTKSPVEAPEIPAHWLTGGERRLSSLDAIARRVVLRAVDHPPGFHAPFHSHSWGQVLALTEGVVRVHAGQDMWIVPPQRALWIPPHVEHDAYMMHHVKLRNVYISPQTATFLPDHCQLFEVSPLLRELIIEAVSFDILYDEDGPEGRCVSVMLDQLQQAQNAPLQLPAPSSAPLRKIARSLAQNPADERTLEEWAQEVGLSSRTLARRFQEETRLSFSQWRQQVRLLHAVPRIAAGEPVALIAQDLGYDSQSAFITMFKRALGKTPGKYFS